MYDQSDPRSSLSAGTPAAKLEEGFLAPSYVRFYEEEPDESDRSVRTWYARGPNAVTAYSDAESGATFERAGQLDEWVLILPDPDVVATLSVAGETHRLRGYSITFVPPGDSVVALETRGRVVRLFTAASQDLLGRSSNAAVYAGPLYNMAAFKPWPMPAGGLKVRTYSLDVPDEPGRFGRIWRCTTFMVNYLAPNIGPRDVRKLSPHHHDDFEQYSLALQGSFVHHLRWPWTVNMKMWREDDHEFCGTPSLTVIPPPSIHTTQAVDPGINQLVDIFSPPRIDFSLKEGWVLNAADYPMPS